MRCNQNQKFRFTLSEFLATKQCTDKGDASETGKLGHNFAKVFVNKTGNADCLAITKFNR